MKVSEIIEDAGINKGVIVSKEGFTPDGISYAKHKNIGLVELRELKETENKKGFIDFNTWVISPEILDIFIHYDGDNKTNEFVKIDSIKIQKNNGEIIPLIDLIMNFKTELKKINLYFKIFERYYDLKDSKLINESNGTDTIIKGIRLKGVLTKREIDLKFHLVDQVWLIMKLHFENRTFTISEKGKIIERKN